MTNGDRQELIPISQKSTSTFPEYVGEGYFVYWGDVDEASRLVDGNALKVTDLRVAPTSGPPGPGRHLAECPRGRLACLVDVRAETIEQLNRASLPLWLDALTDGGTHTSRGLTVAGFTSSGEVAYALLDGFADPPGVNTPLLVSEAVPLTWGPSLAPRAGLRWVHSPSSPCTIDVPTRTLRTINLPKADWDKNTVAGFWGLETSADGVLPVTFTAIWVDARGKATRRVLPVAHRGSSVRNAAGGTTAALTYYERSEDDSGVSARLHVSTDHGGSWRILTVPPHVADNLNRDSRLVAGWESWPEVS